MYGTDETVFHFKCPRTRLAVTYTKIYHCATSHAEGWRLADYRCSAVMSERCRIPYPECPQYEPLDPGAR